MYLCMRENENYWLGGDMVVFFLLFFFIWSVGTESSSSVLAMQYSQITTRGRRLRQHSSRPELLPPPLVAAEEHVLSAYLEWCIFCVCWDIHSHFFPPLLDSFSRFMYKWFNSLKDMYKDECNVHATAFPSVGEVLNSFSKRGRKEG